MRKAGLLAVLALASGLTVGMGSAARPAMAETVLNRGNGLEPGSLDPHRVHGRTDSNILRDLFEGLVVYGPDGRVLPGVAESWDISEDGLTYVFHVRGDARWSNGDTVTAEDIVYSFQRALTPREGYSPPSHFHVIANAEAVMAGTSPAETLAVAATDARTVTIRLRQPAVYFLALLSTDNAALPVHRPTVERVGANWAEPGTLVGNGAYLLAERVPQKHVGLVRNPQFHHPDSVALDRVVYWRIPDPAQERSLFLADKLQVTASVPQDQVRWISLSNPGEFWNRLFVSTSFYAFNMTVEPFKSNRRLRRALALAVNRQAIVNGITRGGEMAAHGLIPPAFPNYQRQVADYMQTPMDERLEEARRVFAEAGYQPTQPLKVQILFSASDYSRVISQTIAAMWREAFGKGIDVELQEADGSEVRKRRLNRDFQIVRDAWVGDYADPTAFLDPMRGNAPSSRNSSGYRNPKFDEALAAAAVERNMARRAELLQQAERIFIDDTPIIPIYHFATRYLVSKRLKGWQYNELDIHPSRFLSLAD